MVIQVNPNPLQKSTGDCVIRAISILLDKTWDEVYTELCVYGYMMKDWGNSNSVWDAMLIDYGYQRNVIPSSCPVCYTVEDFCKDHPKGKYLLATGQHVTVVDQGNVKDSWNSLNEVPILYYEKK